MSDLVERRLFEHADTDRAVLRRMTRATPLSRAQAPTLAQHWHSAPQARVLLTRCKPGEFREAPAMYARGDVPEFTGRTDAACRKLARLDALRTDAIDLAMGYTFASEPFDDAKCRTYLAFDAAVPTVHDVLRGEFARRLEAEVPALVAGAEAQFVAEAA